MPTEQSLIYRSKAAELVRASEQSTNLKAQLELMKRALEWLA
jgi:hypothetical protein